MTTPDPAKPRETPLRGVHERLGASMTEFAGWLMPLRYRSETAEHQAVRSAAGPVRPVAHGRDQRRAARARPPPSTTRWSVSRPRWRPAAPGTR